ncbi:MAG TPA: 1-deoxy-D-xylulose-5-phosphate reductoisomerase, partial [Stellaceae bacterium]|nr:1-deoxy-D-xylulose-5-phosphate reductoisomerase [Stellaceae bacterium]
MSLAISILGSTGSVGCNTAELVAASPERYSVEALVAHRNVELLARQARELKARVAVIADERQYGALKSALAG